VLAVVLVVGGIVFAWQKSASNKVKNDLQGQINTLQSQMQELTKANTTTADWKTYTNQQYKFDLGLPSYFGLPEIKTPNETPYHLTSCEDNKNCQSNTTKALFSLEAEDQRANSTLFITINIFPITSYAYDPIGDGPILYDSINQNWYIDYWDDTTNQVAQRTIAATELKTMERNNWLGYRLNGGDMGMIKYSIAIPHTDKIIEINYGFSCSLEDCANEACTEKIPEPLPCLEDGESKFEEILNTLKFN
ncbi:MAG: hypothetical protein COU83_03060, partial [Candidatus Portnoybacteria bacterium CG10_big_fil_rev_8_21_14_0_10_40_22]